MSGRYSRVGGVWGRSLALAVAVVVLAGCESSQRTFLFDRSTPDEFAVVSRAPLSVPPEYALRPPEPGAPRPQEGTAAQRGQVAVFGGDRQVLQPTGDLTAGQVALLRAAGAEAADPEIRGTLARETGGYRTGDEGFVDALMFWNRPPQGVVLDARAEARRLAEAQALGAPLSGGAVPTIERLGSVPIGSIPQ